LGHADQAFIYIRKLYKIEKDAANQNLVGEDIVRERQEKSKPILDEFERWLALKALHRMLIDNLPLWAQDRAYGARGTAPHITFFKYFSICMEVTS